MIVVSTFYLTKLISQGVLTQEQDSLSEKPSGRRHTACFVKAMQTTMVINPSVWKVSNLSRSEFLRRLRCVKSIRVGISRSCQKGTKLPVISYFSESVKAWGLFEGFHTLVNEGNFSIFTKANSGYVFALMLAP